MATSTIRRDLGQYQKPHIGPILLGNFLEQGFLKLRLSDPEESHFNTMFDTVDAVTALIGLFKDAASKCELASAIEDWNFESATKGSLCIWDPKRIKRFEIA
ncbi:MAG: hypothetical protein Q7S50_02335 [bacterium]|nr:hypothetical protein [bacterium]